jgi:hypothetical protein
MLSKIDNHEAFAAALWYEGLSSGAVLQMASAPSSGMPHRARLNENLLFLTCEISRTRDCDLTE